LAALRAEGRRVAVLAVDPSSPITGGAILGDRVRMMGHHEDAGVFIRSMASRGALGGLARATEAMVRLLSGAGFDDVLIETVGVGQAEVEVARVAGAVIVVLAPGMGDDVQAAKAGILEIATVFAVNKADRDGAAALVRHLQSERPGVPVIETVATEGVGVAALLATVRERWGAAAGRLGQAVRPGAAADFTVNHVGVAVRNIDEALAFWANGLGMRVMLRETVGGEGVQVAMLDAGGSRVELLEPTGPDSVVAKFLATRGPGVHHLALGIRDFRAAVDRLKAGGARLLGEPKRGAGGHTYVFVHPASTGGVLLELIAEEGEA
jgi:LAO/AO transport system kinase